MLHSFCLILLEENCMIREVLLMIARIEMLSPVTILVKCHPFSRNLVDFDSSLKQQK